MRWILRTVYTEISSLPCYTCGLFSVPWVVRYSGGLFIDVVGSLHNAGGYGSPNTPSSNPEITYPHFICYHVVDLIFSSHLRLLSSSPCFFLSYVPSLSFTCDFWQNFILFYNCFFRDIYLTSKALCEISVDYYPLLHGRT